MSIHVKNQIPFFIGVIFRFQHFLWNQYFCISYTKQHRRIKILIFTDPYFCFFILQTSLAFLELLIRNFFASFYILQIFFFSIFYIVLRETKDIKSSLQSIYTAKFSPDIHLRIETFPIFVMIAVF